MHHQIYGGLLFPLVFFKSNSIAMFLLSLDPSVADARSSAAKAFVAHVWKQPETLAAETAANLQDNNWDLDDLVSYQCHKLKMLTTARQRADERSARTIEALEECISCLQCELALQRTAEDLESDLPPKTEEHDEHDGRTCYPQIFIRSYTSVSQLLIPQNSSRPSVPKIHYIFIPLSFRRLPNFNFAPRSALILLPLHFYSIFPAICCSLHPVPNTIHPLNSVFSNWRYTVE
ncbi:hypothetical protein MVEN_01297300 [Mycena venus]|uniref:Uncharacterized protein n=1 Tax=Mycena venus TaxID=2733690 RepID=A0A8H7CVR4_9AGAR|nr:hypothetical protein MVEN_01297300 [Mycena venus]